jgi:hypothetical protein
MVLHVLFVLIHNTQNIKEPETHIRKLHRGSITDKEIQNIYDTRFDPLLYKIVAVDKNGNSDERPSSDENPFDYKIKILDK